MRRLPSILLLLTFLGLGSGLFEYLHSLEHAREDAQLLAAGQQPQQHDESNCSFHRQLHLPAISGQIVPLLIFLGLFVAFLSLLTPEPVHHRPISRLTCRGPPALLPIFA